MYRKCTNLCGEKFSQISRILPRFAKLNLCEIVFFFKIFLFSLSGMQMNKGASPQVNVVGLGASESQVEQDNNTDTGEGKISYLVSII